MKNKLNEVIINKKIEEGKLVISIQVDDDNSDIDSNYSNNLIEILNKMIEDAKPKINSKPPSMPCYDRYNHKFNLIKKLQYNDITKENINDIISSIFYYARFTKILSESIGRFFMRDIEFEYLDKNEIFYYFNLSLKIFNGEIKEKDYYNNLHQPACYGICHF